MDRAVHLRWAIPDALRRQILLTRGFHVWRLTPGYTPPGGLNGAALTAAETASPENVHRLTGHPAVASKLFDSSNVGAFNEDRETWFVVDDNGRYDFTKTNDVITMTGTVYDEGDTHEYVVAPVDLLGRIGPVSPRGSGTAAYTVPPPVPDVLRVENVMKGVDQQRLRVVWKPNKPSPDAVPTTHYLVYRDRLPNTQPMPGDKPLARATDPDLQDDLIYIGSVAQPANPGDELVFDDDSLLPLPAALGNTYFYCVRAAHLGPFGYNTSAPGPPVFGTLRDREGPPAPTGHVATDCPRTGVVFDLDPSGTPNFSSATLIGPADIPPKKAVLRFNATRGLADGSAKDVAWVIFKVAATDPISLHLTPFLFFGSGDRVTSEIEVPANGTPFVLSVTAATTAGRISHEVFANIEPLIGGNLYEVKAASVGVPTAEIQPLAPFWGPYFPNPPQTLAPTVQIEGTARANIATELKPFPRSLLIQTGSTLSPWFNYTTARLAGNTTQFVFREPSEDFPLARAWEIFDPIDPLSDIQAPAQSIDDCPHQAHTPESQEVAPIQVILEIPVGAKEYRLYRRVDDGALTLMNQATERWDDTEVLTKLYLDEVIPSSGGRVAYFGQALDEHGNPSPLVKIGEREMRPVLPIPVIDTPVMGGTLTAPTVTLRAVCPSPGVSRIEFTFDKELPPTPGSDLVESDKTVNIGGINIGSLIFNFGQGVAVTEPHDYTKTLLGPATIAPDASVPRILERTVNIEPGVEYSVFACAIGADGKPGPPGPPMLFTWTPPLVGDTVPWPARPVPPVVTWHTMIEAFETKAEHFEFTSTPPERIVTSHPIAQYPVAVRIGRIPFSSSSPGGGSNWEVRGLRTEGYLETRGASGFDPVNPKPDLMKQFLAPRVTRHGDVFVTESDQSLFPIVLYRRQTHRDIAGESVPTPDADIIQATPMIEHIAWTPYPTDAPTGALFTDPFVGAAMMEPLGVAPYFADLCLFDNSPVAYGATYQYYLVHFNPDGEPDAIIDAGSITISDQPSQ